MPKPASTRPAYKMLTCIYLCRTLLFFAPYADFFIKKVIRMEKNIGEYLSRKSTEVIAIVACIGLIITIILAAGSIRTEQEKAHMVLHSSCLQTK